MSLTHNAAVCSTLILRKGSIMATINFTVARANEIIAAGFAAGALGHTVTPYGRPVIDATTDGVIRGIIRGRRPGEAVFEMDTSSHLSRDGAVIKIQSKRCALALEMDNEATARCAWYSLDRLWRALNLEIQRVEDEAA